MQQFNLQRIVCALLLACGIASWAAQVAVPTPRPYTSRLPANIVGEVYRTVCDGVAGAGFSVLSEGASNELLKSIETQDRTAQTTILQEKGIAGLLRAELNRGLGGFVLHVEPMACQSGLGLPTEPFDIQIGQYQNLRRCVAELTAMLNSGKVGNQAPMTALLAPRIQEPLAPLYLGNYLSGRLESGLLQRGYRLCAPAVVAQVLRQNRLGGCFELTQAR